MATDTIAVAQSPDTDELQQGIVWSIQGQYQSALTLFEHVKMNYPQHPAGAFFLAALWQSRMMDFETRRWQKQFYREVDLAVRLAVRQLKRNPADAEMLFFLGAALSYKSFQMARDKNYLDALKIALQAIDHLNQSIKKDTLFCDAYLGIGSYKFWRSQLTQKLSWLPFFPDQSQEGIALLLKVKRCGRYSKWAALSNLTWIYIERQEYELAIDAAEEGLEIFPESRFFLWPLGDAFFKNGDFTQARDTFEKILASIQKESINNGYNEALLRWKLAQCCFNLGDSATAQIHCAAIIEIKPENEVKNRVEEKKKAAKELLERLQSRD